MDTTWWLFFAVGMGAQLVDGALGMAFGVTATTVPAQFRRCAGAGQRHGPHRRNLHGQPEEASRTGTILVKPDVQGHHPQPEDLRRRALELSRSLGLRAEEHTARDDKAKEFVARSSRMCRCSTPARAARRSLSSSAVSAMCCITWENEAFLASTSSARTSSTSSRRPFPSSLSRRSPSLTRSSTEHGTREAAEAYLKFLYSQGRPGDRRQAFLPPARS